MAIEEGSHSRIAELYAARNVFIGTLILNLMVALAKIGCGLWSNTLSMLADGFHSLLDASSNVVGIIGITISSRPADAGHPYGHRKFEALSAIFISFLMFLTCFEVLRESFVRVTNSNIEKPVVTAVSYIVMFSTMFVNIGVARYEALQGARLNSPLLIADSKHTLSDVFATCGVLISLVSIQMNFPLVDVIASVAIVGIILRAGYGIIESNLGSLVDAAVIDPSRIEALVLSVPGVTSCHKIRSRGMQDAIFIDLHVQVPHHLSIEEAHAISSNVEAKLKQSSPAITEVLVHIEDDTGATH